MDKERERERDKRNITTLKGGFKRWFSNLDAASLKATFSTVWAKNFT